MAKRDESVCIEKLRAILARERDTNVVFDHTNGSIREIISSCKPNPIDNAFPDFLFPNGALEHFQIGSSPEFPRGGSKFKCEEAQNKKRNAALMAQSEQKYLSSPAVPWTYESKILTDVYENFSYEDFIFSFKSHLGSHINSLRNSGKVFDAVIFLMEQQTARMGVWKNNSFERFYLLSKDKAALDVLAGYSDDVNYVIYMAGDAVEVIDLSKITDLLETAESGRDIRGDRKIQTHIGLYITI